LLRQRPGAHRLNVEQFALDGEDHKESRFALRLAICCPKKSKEGD